MALSYDASHESRVALEGAAKLAAKHDAAVRVFTVVPPSGPEGYDRPHAEVEELRRDHYRTILGDALKALPAVIRPEGRLLSGDVEAQLVEQANASLDVMVVGSRAYGPLRRVLLGSPSNAPDALGALSCDRLPAGDRARRHAVSERRRPGVTEQRQTTTEQAKRVGDEIGVDWDRFDLEQFRFGMDVEFEHGSHDPETDVTGDDPIPRARSRLRTVRQRPAAARIMAFPCKSA